MDCGNNTSIPAYNPFMGEEPAKRMRFESDGIVAQPIMQASNFQLSISQAEDHMDSGNNSSIPADRPFMGEGPAKRMRLESDGVVAQPIMQASNFQLSISQASAYVQYEWTEFQKHSNPSDQNFVNFIRFVVPRGHLNESAIDELVLLGASSAHEVNPQDITSFVNELVQKNDAYSNAYVKRLLPYIPPDASDASGNTPLMIATSVCNMEMLGILFTRPNIDTNQQNLLGETALHFTATVLTSFEKRLDIAQSLVLRMGANVNAKDRNGDTPLVKAAAVNDLQMVMGLKSLGATDSPTALLFLKYLCSITNAVNAANAYNSSK